MVADPLSEVLELTRARSVITGGFVAGGAWAVHFSAPVEMKFAVLTKGSCWIRLDGQKRGVHVEQGDVGLFPGGHGYVVASSLDVRPQEATRVFAHPVGSCPHPSGSVAVPTSRCSRVACRSIPRARRC